MTPTPSSEGFATRETLPPGVISSAPTVRDYYPVMPLPIMAVPPVDPVDAPATPLEIFRDLVATPPADDIAAANAISGACAAVEMWRSGSGPAEVVAVTPFRIPPGPIFISLEGSTPTVQVMKDFWQGVLTTLQSQVTSSYSLRAPQIRLILDGANTRLEASVLGSDLHTRSIVTFSATRDSGDINWYRIRYSLWRATDYQVMSPTEFAHFIAAELGFPERPARY